MSETVCIVIPSPVAMPACLPLSIGAAGGTVRTEGIHEETRFVVCKMLEPLAKSLLPSRDDERIVMLVIRSCWLAFRCRMALLPKLAFRCGRFWDLTAVVTRFNLAERGRPWLTSSLPDKEPLLLLPSLLFRIWSKLPLLLFLITLSIPPSGRTPRFKLSLKARFSARA